MITSKATELLTAKEFSKEFFLLEQPEYQGIRNNTVFWKKVYENREVNYFPKVSGLNGVSIEMIIHDWLWLKKQGDIWRGNLAKEWELKILESEISIRNRLMLKLVDKEWEEWKL